MPASQAGRRGFEPRLPLHLFNNLASPTSRGFTSFTSKSGFHRRFSFNFLLCRFPRHQGALKFGHRFPSAFQITFGVRIDSDADRMPTLVGSDLRVYALFVAEAGLSSAQHLEVNPTEPDPL